LQFQLVQRVVPEAEVLDEALRWARHAATVPSDRFAHGKDKIRRSVELLGLHALTSVLDPHASATDDKRAAEFAGAMRDKGLQETMRSRNAGIDPSITKV
jgi:enoyl-CoA hydratase/carnithine racemase